MQRSQMIYMGQALMVFATEVAILRSRGEDNPESRGRIAEILDAFDELDRSANYRFGSPDGEKLNGLFVRDDVVGVGDPRIPNVYDRVDSDWQHPERENTSSSGDQILGLLDGLICVVAYSGDADLCDRAAEMALRLFRYAQGTNFILRLPNGEATRRGSDTRWLASFLHDKSFEVTRMDLFDESRIVVGRALLPLDGLAFFWRSPSTARLVAALSGTRIDVPPADTQISVNSFALHILQMAVAPTQSWTQCELERVLVKTNHHLSALVFSTHSSMLPTLFDESTVLAIMDACPESGPSEELQAHTGWTKDNRWVRCTNIFDPPPSGRDRQFNGLDWLVLHNLHQLVYVGSGKVGASPSYQQSKSSSN